MLRSALICVSMSASDKLSVSPTSLYFPAPYNRSLRNVLVFQNSSHENCVFKFKTVFPERYLVKPRMLVVAPKSLVRINITLHPLEGPSAVATKNLPAEPSTEAGIQHLNKGKEKFQVLAKMVPKDIDKAQNLKVLWDMCPTVELNMSIPCVFFSSPEACPDNVEVYAESPSAASPSTKRLPACSVVREDGTEAAAAAAASPPKQLAVTAVAAAAAASTAAGINAAQPQQPMARAPEKEKGDTKESLAALKVAQEVLKTDIKQAKMQDAEKHKALAAAHAESELLQLKAREAAAESNEEEEAAAGGIQLSLVLALMILAYAVGLLIRGYYMTNPESVREYALATFVQFQSMIFGAQPSEATMAGVVVEPAAAVAPVAEEAFTPPTNL